MELGTRIKNLREEAGLTQLAFAKILNINNSTLSQYESGDRIPSDITKIKIADYFGVSLDFLLGRTDKKGLPAPTEEDGQDDQEKELLELISYLTPDQKAFLLIQLRTLLGQAQ